MIDWLFSVYCAGFGVLTDVDRFSVSGTNVLPHIRTQSICLGAGFQYSSSVWHIGGTGRTLASRSSTFVLCRELARIRTSRAMATSNQDVTYPTADSATAVVFPGHHRSHLDGLGSICRTLYRTAIRFQEPLAR